MAKLKIIRRVRRAGKVWCSLPDLSFRSAAWVQDPERELVEQAEHREMVRPGRQPDIRERLEPSDRENRQAPRPVQVSER